MARLPGGADRPESRCDRAREAFLAATGRTRPAGQVGRACARGEHQCRHRPPERQRPAAAARPLRRGDRQRRVAVGDRRAHHSRCARRHRDRDAPTAQPAAAAADHHPRLQPLRQARPGPQRPWRARGPAPGADPCRAGSVARAPGAADHRRAAPAGVPHRGRPRRPDAQRTDGAAAGCADGVGRRHAGCFPRRHRPSRHPADRAAQRVAAGDRVCRSTRAALSPTGTRTGSSGTHPGPSTISVRSATASWAMPSSRF